jgi:hypothetical protein
MGETNRTHKYEESSYEHESVAVTWKDRPNKIPVAKAQAQVPAKSPASKQTVTARAEQSGTTKLQCRSHLLRGNCGLATRLHSEIRYNVIQLRDAWVNSKKKVNNKMIR